MTVRPILFSGPMVRALLEGRKTQTRRILKPQIETFEVAPGKECDIDICWDVDDGRGRIWKGSNGTGALTLQTVPYAPGDVLWVRETWAQHHPAGVQEGRFSVLGEAGIPGPPPVTYRVIYKADGDPVRVWQSDEYPYRTAAGPSDELAARHPAVCSEMPGWAPSIHMPRKFSRLTLQVTGVKVERLQDISEADVDAEVFGGDFPHHVLPNLFPEGHEAGSLSLPECFARLWDSINTADGTRWADNPWVVAVTFTVHQQNVDAFLAGKAVAA